MRFHITLRSLAIMATVCTLRQTANAQYTLTQANKAYNLYNLEDAKPLYALAWKKKQTAGAARGAADSYRLTKDYVFSESWYAKLWTVEGHTPEDELHYASVLMSNSKYSEAAGHLHNYLHTMPGDERARNMLAGCDSASYWLAHPKEGNIENMQALNSAYSDWSITYYNKKYVFASDRPYNAATKAAFFEGNYIHKKNYSFSGNSYLHLYEGNGKDSNTVQLMDRQYVNGDYHSASAAYTSTGKKLYVAITSLIKKHASFLGKDSDYTINIYIKEIKQDSAQHWQNAPVFPLNSALKYSIGDPWISPNGDTLYFTSNQGAGHHGGTDIYYTVNTNGQWGTPVNMGGSINTEGNERTPFFDATGKFYFASDGKPGLGGLDIFTATKKGDSTWTVTNAGSPVNSPQDDFAPAVIDQLLYISSNRFDGKGSDDIYRFNPSHILYFDLRGTVLDKKDNRPLSNVVVTLQNKKTGIPLTVNTDSKGQYHFQLDSVTDYALSASKTDYNSISDMTLTTKGIDTSATVKMDFAIEKTVVKTPIRIDNIYFDLAKADIRPDAALELDKLVKLLNDNPTWEIEMASHTDSRAPDAFNLALSQKRAAATVAYLVKHGIAAERLTAKGYGETRLLNKCANGVDCSEAEHQQNRRTEFTILDK